MTNLKIAALLVILALASWRPFQEQKANIVRAVAAAAMNSVVKAQSADSVQQTDLDAAVPSSESRAGAKVTHHQHDCTCRHPLVGS